MTIMNGAYINGLDNLTTNGLTTTHAVGTTTTDYILFSLTVPDITTGDIYYGIGNNLLAANGSITQVAHAILDPVVKAGVTGGHCTKVWLSIGGANTQTFANIQTIFNNGGQAVTNLITNLAALATSLKSLSSNITSVGFDMDNEDNQADAMPAVVALVVALYNHGLKQSPAVKYQFTFCAYVNDTYWFNALASVYSGLNGVQPVVGITLQTYAGGNSNDPRAWTSALETYIQNDNKPTGLSSATGFILPILSMDNTAWPWYTPSQMTSNLEMWQSTGGSFWATQALFQPQQAQPWSDYAAAIASGIES